MLQHRNVRIGVMLAAIVATAVTAVLPAAHVHTGNFGQPELHRHLVDDVDGHDDDQHAATIGHHDHHEALTLASTFVGQRHFSIARPMPAVALMLTPPVAPIVSLIASVDMPIRHGPPLRPTSLRAPPA